MDTAVLLLVALFAGIIFGFYMLAMKVNAPRRGATRRVRSRREPRVQPAPMVEVFPYARVQRNDEWSEWTHMEPLEAGDARWERNWER